MLFGGSRATPAQSSAPGRNTPRAATSSRARGSASATFQSPLTESFRTEAQEQFAADASPVESRHSLRGGALRESSTDAVFQLREAAPLSHDAFVEHERGGSDAFAPVSLNGGGAAHAHGGGYAEYDMSDDSDESLSERDDFSHEYTARDQRVAYNSQPLDTRLMEMLQDADGEVSRVPFGRAEVSDNVRADATPSALVHGGVPAGMATAQTFPVYVPVGPDGNLRKGYGQWGKGGKKAIPVRYFDIPIPQDNTLPRMIIPVLVNHGDPIVGDVRQSVGAPLEDTQPDTIIRPAGPIFQELKTMTRGTPAFAQAQTKADDALCEQYYPPEQDTAPHIVESLVLAPIATTTARGVGRNIEDKLEFRLWKRTITYDYIDTITPGNVKQQNWVKLFQSLSVNNPIPIPPDSASVGDMKAFLKSVLNAKKSEQAILRTGGLRADHPQWEIRRLLITPTVKALIFNQIAPLPVVASFVPGRGGAGRAGRAGQIRPTLAAVPLPNTPPVGVRVANNFATPVGVIFENLSVTNVITFDRNGLDNFLRGRVPPPLHNFLQKAQNLRFYLYREIIRAKTRQGVVAYNLWRSGPVLRQKLQQVKTQLIAEARGINFPAWATDINHDAIRTELVNEMHLYNRLYAQQVAGFLVHRARPLAFAPLPPAPTAAAPTAAAPTAAAPTAAAPTAAAPTAAAPTAAATTATATTAAPPAAAPTTATTANEDDSVREQAEAEPTYDDDQLPAFLANDLWNISWNPTELREGKLHAALMQFMNNPADEQIPGAYPVDIVTRVKMSSTSKDAFGNIYTALNVLRGNEGEKLSLAKTDQTRNFSLHPLPDQRGLDEEQREADRASFLGSLSLRQYFASIVFSENQFAIDQGQTSAVIEDPVDDRHDMLTVSAFYEDSYPHENLQNAPDAQWLFTATPGMWEATALAGNADMPLETQLPMTKVVEVCIEIAKQKLPRIHGRTPTVEKGDIVFVIHSIGNHVIAPKTEKLIHRAIFNIGSGFDTMVKSVSSESLKPVTPSRPAARRTRAGENIPTAPGDVRRNYRW